MHKIMRILTSDKNAAANAMSPELVKTFNI